MEYLVTQSKPHQWIVTKGDDMIGSIILQESEEDGRIVKRYFALDSDHLLQGIQGTILGAKCAITGEPYAYKQGRPVYV